MEGIIQEVAIFTLFSSELKNYGKLFRDLRVSFSNKNQHVDLQFFFFFSEF